METNNSEAIYYIRGSAFSPIKITTHINAQPYYVANSKTVNTLKNRLYPHWEDNPSDVQVNW